MLTHNTRLGREFPELSVVNCADSGSDGVSSADAGSGSGAVSCGDARRVASADAYVTVLPPADPADLVDHALRLVSAGAHRLSFYHLGLAGADRQTLFARIVSAVTEGRP